MWSVRFCFFVFNATATTEIYTYGHTLSRHDALPISLAGCGRSISRHRREKIQLAKKRDAVLNRAPSSTFFWEAQPLQGPTLVLVTCICISMSPPPRSEEHTSELQSLMRSSYAVFCLKKQKQTQTLSYLRSKHP